MQKLSSRYADKFFTQIYKELYGDAMPVPVWMGTNMVAETCVTEFCYKSANLSLGELKNTK